MGIVELALNAASEIPATMGAGIPSHYLAFNADFVSTKGTLHDLLSSMGVNKVLTIWVLKVSISLCNLTSLISPSWTTQRIWA